MTSIELTECSTRRAGAIGEFAEKEHRSDASVVVTSLAHGLTGLRKLMFERVHDDVERRFGMDSMLMPASENRMRARTLVEIEIYQVAIATIHAQQRAYVNQPKPWFLNWLTGLRLGEAKDSPQVQSRLSQYLKLDKAERRLAFTDALVRALPEAGRAPLVLYRLFPLAIKIVTSVAFGDVATAVGQRDQQLAFLPAIGDCSQCKGQPLDNGEICRMCGNPVWRYDWLTATD